MKHEVNDYTIEQALDLILEKENLKKKVDSRLFYEIKNRDTRNVSKSKRLLAIYQAGLFKIDLSD